MLDEFVWGRVSRISPEAPVPVVEVINESSYPGGAANVARNLVEFTPTVAVLGLVGEDAHARALRELLESEKITTTHLVSQAAFPTIVKTRIIARQQQVVRVDREKKVRLDAALLERTVEAVRVALDQTDAVIFEDYGKGVISQALFDAVIPMCRERGLVVTVDPNPNNPLDWRGVSAIKPNRSEAFAAAGVPYSEPSDDPLKDDALLRVGSTLLEQWDAESLLITLSEHGMLLLSRGRDPHHIPTRAREVFDVSGAGDTAIALFTLALAAGSDPVEAAEVSNLASGIVVGKLGTATVSPEELLASCG